MESEMSETITSQAPAMGRVELKSAAGRLAGALHARDPLLCSRLVETGGYGTNVGGKPVRFELHIWDHGNGPINIGYDHRGMGVSREPDHVIDMDIDGWAVASFGLSGSWNITFDRGLPVADVRPVAALVADEIGRRR